MAIVPVLIVAAFLMFLGTRLVRSGLRSEGAELWLGAFFVSASTALPLRLAIAMGLEVGVNPAPLNLIAQAVLYLGVLGFAAFVWKTFRPEGLAGRLGFGLVAALFSTNLLIMRVSGAYTSQAHPFHIVLSASLTTVFAWAFLETLLYHARMRKRADLGLADPVVTNRFFLFTIWTGALTVLPIVVTFVRTYQLMNGLDAPTSGAPSLAVQPGSEWTLRAVRLAVVALGPAVVTGMWLGFFPPARYTRWLRARAVAR